MVVSIILFGIAGLGVVGLIAMYLFRPDEAERARRRLREAGAAMESVYAQTRSDMERAVTDRKTGLYRSVDGLQRTWQDG